MFDIFEICQLASRAQQFELVFSLWIAADIHCIHCSTFPKINNNLPYLSIAYIIYISYYIFLSYFFYNSFHFIFFLISFISMESEIVYNRYECFYIISRFSSSLYFVPEKEKKWKKKEIICNSKRQQQQPQQYCSLCWA